MIHFIVDFPSRLLRSGGTYELSVALQVSTYLPNEVTMIDRLLHISILNRNPDRGRANDVTCNSPIVTLYFSEMCLGVSTVLVRILLRHRFIMPT